MLSLIRTTQSSTTSEVKEKLREINYSSVHGKVINDKLYVYNNYDAMNIDFFEDAPKIVVYSAEGAELHRYGESENTTKIAFGKKYHVVSQGAYLETYVTQDDGSIDFNAPLSRLELPLNLVEGEVDHYSVFYSDDFKYVLWNRNSALGVAFVSDAGILDNLAVSEFPLNTELKTAVFREDTHAKVKSYIVVALLKSVDSANANVYTFYENDLKQDSSTALDVSTNDLDLCSCLKRVAIVSNRVALGENQLNIYRLTGRNNLVHLEGQTFNSDIVAVTYGPNDYVALVAKDNDLSQLLLSKLDSVNVSKSHVHLTDVFNYGENSKYVTWNDCSIFTTASLASETNMPIYLTGLVSEKGGLPRFAPVLEPTPVLEPGPEPTPEHEVNKKSKEFSKKLSKKLVETKILKSSLPKISTTFDAKRSRTTQSPIDAVLSTHLSETGPKRKVFGRKK